MVSSGEWLEAALLDLAGRTETGLLQLDADVVSGLVSYCELAPPEDAREYLTVLPLSIYTRFTSIFKEIIDMQAGNYSY